MKVKNNLGKYFLVSLISLMMSQAALAAECTSSEKTEGKINRYDSEGKATCISPNFQVRTGQSDPSCTACADGQGGNRGTDVGSGSSSSGSSKSSGTAR